MALKNLTITKKEAAKRKRTATIHDEGPGHCERCGKKETEKEPIFQDSDYAWICNVCAWTRNDRQAV